MKLVIQDNNSNEIESMADVEQLITKLGEDAAGENLVNWILRVMDEQAEMESEQE